MAWNATVTFTTGSVLTAAQCNSYMRDNLDFLHASPACIVRRFSDMTISNSTVTALNFATANATEDYDTDSMHDLTTNSTRLTVNTAGVYAFWGVVVWAANATGIRQAKIVKNSSTEIVTVQDTSPGGAVLSRQHMAPQDLAAVTDFYELQVSQTSGGNLAVNGGTSAPARAVFGAQRIGYGP